MNIHLAQSIQARNELKRIANVQYQIVSVKNSSPIIGCQQDTLSGAYMMTQPNVKLMGWEVANLLCNTTSETKMQIEMNKMYSGHEIFSHIIPVGINMLKKSGDKTLLEINNGKLVQGFLDKSALSFAKNSIIHFIWDKFGPSKTRRFIDDSQRLILSYLLMRGQTVGFKDTMVNDTMDKQIKQYISNKILETKYNITQHENDTDQLAPSLIESSIASSINLILPNIGQMLMNHFDINNFFWAAAKSGAKGDATNVSQVSGLVGQINVEGGSRLKKNVEGRSLIYFHRDDDTPEARGFVNNSFLAGLQAFEFFANAKAGREGLIDTAIKSVTWETPIIVIENKLPKYIEIGKWIDEKLEANPKLVQHFEERQMEMLDLEDGVYIPTTDYHGNVYWGNISAVTRHDPGTELYEIKTSGGRNVIVTESKSLLIWNKETHQFKEKLTPDIIVGDCVPVTMNLCEPNNYIETNNIEEALYASESCIIKLLKETINSNGTINDYSIIINTTNDKNKNIIVMLLTRIGIYSRLSESSITINGKWATHLCQKIKLFENINFIDTTNDITFNNVVLDEITEINLVDVKAHPKVYDLTIPSTFNFGLANGLMVRDTAQTGYISRQLIKGLEDLSIRYDGTNRNAKGIIIQTVYGENGINQSTQTELVLNILAMNNNNISEKLGFSSEQIKKLVSNKKLKQSEKELKEFNTNHNLKLQKLRDEMRTIQTLALLNFKTLTEKFVSPVNLFRITQDYSNKKECIELEPMEIVNAIEKFLTDYDNRLITSMKMSDKFMKQDDRRLKFLLEVALNEYLAPVKCIFEYGLSKKEFYTMMDEIKNSFIKSIIEPGEMVGIIAAQSIGEPTQQMSLDPSSKIKLIIKNKKTNNLELYSKEIGPFCDNLINQHQQLTYNTGHIDSVETDLTSLENEYYIVGVSEKEGTKWNKLSHVSRHPVNGMMMTVTTKSGRTATTTMSHSHLIRKNQSVVPIVGYDLKKGMRIPVARHIDNTHSYDTMMIGDTKYELDYLFGWFIGAYLAEGNISKTTICITNISQHFIDNVKAFAKRIDKNAKDDHYMGEYGPGVTTKFSHKALSKFMLETIGTGSYVKKVPDFAFLAPNEFKAGLIQAYFDGDGNFEIHERNKQIRVCSRSEQLIKDIALMLSYFDMFASTKMTKVKGANLYNLTMSSRYAIPYKQHIGSLVHKERLENIVNYAMREDAHNLSDEIDKINGLGEVIARCGKVLGMQGQSRTYGRWLKKDTIGRRTLNKYIAIFEAHENVDMIQSELMVLRQAANSDVIWDEIVKIDIFTPEQNAYVYDFTVPGNQTFMIDNGLIVHNTLNTKHSAGAAGKGSANMGVSRIQELVHYSKNIKTPQMTIYFDEPYATDRAKLNKIVSYFKHLSIRQLISSAEVYYDTNSGDMLSKKIKGDNVISPFFVNNMKADISSLPFVFRIKFDIEKMLDKETTLLDIKTKFISHWYKNYTNLKNLKKNEKDVISRISRCAILSNGSMDKEQIIHIRFSMTQFNYTVITEFLRMVFDDITLKGVENIDAIDVSPELRIKFDKETGDVITGKEFVVTTSGINFDKIRMIKGLNMERVKCNDIATTLRLYGIEATRQMLINELTATYESNSASVNNNHLSLLVDQMCHMGEITSIDRHGLSKIDMDPLARASFEMQMDHFVNASIFNEKDTMKSVSSRIAVGRVISGGTGIFDLLLDTKKLESSEYTEDETGGRITFIPLEEEPLFDDIMKYTTGKNNFFIPSKV